MADEKPEYDAAMGVYNSLNATQKAEAGSFMGEASKLYTDSKSGQIPADILKKSMEDIRDEKDPYLNLPKKQETHGASLEEKVHGHDEHHGDIGGKAAEAHGTHKHNSTPNWMKAAAAVAFFYFLGAPYFI